MSAEYIEIIDELKYALYRYELYDRMINCNEGVTIDFIIEIDEKIKSIVKINEPILLNINKGEYDYCSIGDGINDIVKSMVDSYLDFKKKEKLNEKG